jgi:hypothetical protein
MASFSKDQWWEVCREAAPTLTREWFDVLWDDFLHYKNSIHPQPSAKVLPMPLKLSPMLDTIRDQVNELGRLRDALTDIEELVDGYADVDDGQPNLAMQVLVVARTALRREP